MVSIVILSHRRFSLLERLISSIESARGTDLAGVDFEILLVSNGESPQAYAQLQNRFEQTQGLRLYRTHLPTGDARNFAVAHAKGDWICFLDDDVFLPAGYFRTALERIGASVSEKTGRPLSAFGGPDLTPPNSSSFQNFVGVTLSSALATWKTRYRHTSVGTDPCEGGEDKLTLCNLWIKRSLFSAHGGPYSLASRLIRNEENLLLFRMKADGHLLLYFPDLFVFHERRLGVSGVFSQAFRSGLCRVESFKRDPASLELCYLTPLLSIASFALFSLLSGFWGCFTLLSIYCAVLGVASGLALQKNWNWRIEDEGSMHSLAWVAWLHFVIHSAYALGSAASVAGLYRWIEGSSKTVSFEASPSQI